MEIRPIRNEEDYNAALEEIERLFDVPPDTPEADRLDVLTTLVEAYEEQHYPILPPDPIEALSYYLESRGLSPDDLEPLLGSQTEVEEILNRRRPLTIEMIRRLRTSLGIPADALIQPYPLLEAAA